MTMTTREELHNLVDQLNEEPARQLLAYARWLLKEPPPSGDTATAHTDRTHMPPMTSSSAFFSESQDSLETLAMQQRVQPVSTLDELLGDFWPENETADEFIAAVRRWRSENEDA